MEECCIGIKYLIQWKCELILDLETISFYNIMVYVKALIRNSKRIAFFRELSVGARQQMQALNSPLSSFGEVTVVGSGDSRYRILSA